ncbi:uncharacterized protein PRCAT00004495001 [Priceomyces carsonii]|uniref:uncharacterized protein n=1 Tax=Priceomyces carsonii TaxID=28549 RepID=UPI002EDB9D58|nr:unnamed protein product [Priceomyces carsonii]
MLPNPTGNALNDSDISLEGTEVHSVDQSGQMMRSLKTPARQHTALEDSSSTASSPFISNPEELMMSRITTRDEYSDLDDKQEIDSVVDGLDGLRIESPNISRLDSTRINDTRAQLDLDFDLDDSDDIIPSASRKSRLRNTWSNLRTSSVDMFRPPHSAFSQKEYTKNDSYVKTDMIPRFLTQDAISSSSRVDELNKQITGYKIQVKFFRQFLQSLIDKARNDSSGTTSSFSLSELTDFQSNFNEIAPQALARTELVKLELDYNNLAETYDLIYQLNQDLYENLEQFEKQLKEKSCQLEEQRSYIESCSKIVDEVFLILISGNERDRNPKPDIAVFVEYSKKPLDLKIQSVRTELSKRAELSYQKNYPSPPSSNRDSHHATSSADNESITSLMKALQDLQSQHSEYQLKTSEAEAELRTELQESKHFKEQYQDLLKKYNELCSTVENSPDKKIIGNEDELKQKMENKLREYEATISDLQKELSLQKQDENDSINETIAKLLNDSRSLAESEIQKQSVQWKRDFRQLNDDLGELTQEYLRSKNESSKTIEELLKKLDNRRLEIKSLKANQVELNRLKDDLERSIEVQRKLKAEKIKLSYSIEALTNEKVSLQSTIGSLTDKITSLVIAANNNQDNNRNSDLPLEAQLREFLLFDVCEFQKFLSSFNKIADDISLKEPTRKIEVLRQRLKKNKPISSGTDWSAVTMEYHKSVFEYFSRAVDIIVNDHVKLLLKENDTNTQHSTYISKLHKRIDDLNAVNESLSNQLSMQEFDNQSVDDSGNTSSPVAKLRIEELSKRWKSEREARVYENNEARIRLKELEQENLRLRSQLHTS